MSDVFITSDLHLFHPNCAKLFRGFESVEEHDELIIDNWNSMVTKRDVVYVLGDVALRRDGVWKVMRLNGIKRLILGNHDIHMKDLMVVFNGKIYSSLRKYDLFMTHIPIEANQIEITKWMNVHGHVHNKEYSPKGNYFNVNIEHWDYKPLPIEQIKE